MFPKFYLECNEKHMDEKDIIEKILTLKEALGKELIILTHHYQRKEIVDIGETTVIY